MKARLHGGSVCSREQRPIHPEGLDKGLEFLEAEAAVIN